MKRIFNKFKRIKEERIYGKMYARYGEYTRIPFKIFMQNLDLMLKFSNEGGVVVECGVWRGGMMAALGELKPDLIYYLFDSFEGLPEARQIDGIKAIDWMQGNDIKCCSTEEKYAFRVMKMAKVKKFQIEKGWFNKTLPNYNFHSAISVLRLDADWYSSTAECLNYLYEEVKVGGIVIFDDYFAWDGCAKAVHDFLSLNQLADRLHTIDTSIAYIVKSENVVIKKLNPEP